MNITLFLSWLVKIIANQNQNAQAARLREFRFLFTLLLFFSMSTAAHSFSGPLQVKNQFPIFIHANQPYLERAIPETSFSASLSHSSIFTVQNSGEWVIDMDMEITELNLRYKHYIKSIGEIGIDLSFIAFSNGFLDGFLESFHDLIRVHDPYGKSGRPKDDFLYEIRHGEYAELLAERGSGSQGSTAVVLGRTGTGLGDIRLTLKRPLIVSDNYNLSLKGDLELPTGDAKEGYGNGSTDAGVSILYDRRLSDKIMSYWNIGAVFPGDLDGYSNIDLKNFIYGGSAIEIDILKRWDLLFQLQAQSPIYPETDLNAVDWTAYLLAFGCRYHKGSNSIEFSITEDINSTGAPDFTANISYKNTINRNTIVTHETVIFASTDKVI
jgi:hypothetical protein